MNKVLEILNRRLESEHIEIRMTEEDGETKLNAIIEGLGEDEDGAIVCEIAKTEEDENEGGVYYSFYTMIADHLEKETFAPTMLNLNELNTALVVGAYGILTEDGSIFHKYIYRMPEMEDEAAAEALYAVFTDIIASVYNDYEAIFASITE